MKNNTYTFDASIDVNDKELPCTVTFRYIPAEAQTFLYPGCPESVEILSANTYGEGFNEFLLEHCTKDFEEDALEYMHETYDAQTILLRIKVEI